MAEPPTAEKDAARRLADNVRAVLKLISPEHITPMGKRQIERVLDEHTGLRPRVTPPGSGVEDVDDFLTAYDNQPGIDTTVLPPGGGRDDA